MDLRLTAFPGYFSAVKLLCSPQLLLVAEKVVDFLVNKV